MKPRSTPSVWIIFGSVLGNAGQRWLQTALATSHSLFGSLSQVKDAMPYNLPITGDPQKRLDILLVEPDVVPEACRQWLLAEPNYLLTVVNGVRSLFLLGQDHTVAIAVLNDVIGQVPLRTAAESIRRRWPLATIVVIGQAAPALEDHLYDETVSHGLDQVRFLDAIHQLKKNDKAATLPAGSGNTVFALPTLMESDPSKTPHPVRVAMTGKDDMPGGAYRMHSNQQCDVPQD